MGIRLLLWLGIPLLVLLLLIASAVGFLHTDSGRALLAGQIEKIASSQDRKLDIGRISGSLFSTFSVESINLTDKDGEWLEISNLSVEWSPLQIMLGRELRILKLEADGLTLINLPSSSQDSTHRSAISLPADVRLDEISIRRIQLSEAVVGTDAVLSLNGRISVPMQLENAFAEFSLDRLDDAGGSMRFSASFDKPGGNLALELELEENAGGVVANYLRLREKPPLKLSLSGDGFLNHWSGQVRMDAGNETVVEGTVATRYLENTVELEASLDARVEHLVPMEFAELLKGELNLNLQSSFREDGTKEIGNFEIASDTVNARVSGSVDSQGAPERFEAHVSANSPSDPLLSQLGLNVLGSSSLDAKLDFQREGEAYQWNLAGDIGDFVWFENTVDRVSLTAAGEFPLTGGGDTQVIPLKADFEFESSKLSNSRVQKIVGSSVDISAGGFFTTNGSVGIESGVLTNWLGVFDFSLGFDKGILTVEALTEESEFLKVFELVDFPVGGDADLAADVKVDFPGKRFEVEVESKTSGIELGIGQLDSLLRGKGKLKGKGTGNFKLDDFSIAEFRAGTSEMEFSVYGDYIGGELDLNVEAEIVDLESIAGELAGGLKAIGTVEGKAGTPRLDLELSSETFSVLGKQLENLRAQLDLTADIVDPKGNLTVVGKLKGDSLDASIALAGSKNNRYDFDEIRVSVANAEIHGNAEVSKNGIIEGEASVFSSDIRELAGLFPVDAGGALNAEMKFSNSNGRQSISMEIKGEGLTTSDVWVESAEFMGTIQDIWDLSSMEGQLSAKNVEVKDQVIDSVDGTVSRNDGESEFSISALAFESAIDLDGTIAIEQDAVVIDLERSAIDHNSQKLVLAEPVRMQFRDGVFETGQTNWQSNFGGLSVSGKSNEKFQLSLDKVSLSAINMFFPELELAGLLTGASELNFSNGELQVSWNVSVNGATSPLIDRYGLQDFSMLASGEIVGQKISYNVRVTNEQYVNFESEGSLQLDGMNMSGNLTGKIPMQIANVVPAISSLGIELEGIFSVDMTANGSFLSPEIEGTISLSDGTVNHREYGIRMAAVDMEANIEGKDLKILDFTGNFDEGGMLGLTGLVRVDPAESFPIDLELKGDIPLATANLFPRVAERNIDLQGDLTAEVSFVGKVLSPEIDGRFAISEGNFNFTEQGIRVSRLSMKADYKNQTLNIVEMTGRLNESGILELQGNVEIDEDSTFPSNLLLNGEIPMDVVSQIPAITSLGISIGGNSVVEVAVTGNIQSPEISGRFSVTEGTFSHAVEDIHFSELMVTAEIENNRLSIERLTGRMNKGGTIEVSGFIDINRAESFPASLIVSISDGIIVQEQLLSMTFDSELNIDGPLLTGPKMVGKLDISQMEIQIPERLPGGYSDIDVEHVSASESVVNQNRIVYGRRDRESMSTPFNAQIDIEITAPESGFLIRGRGVLAEMGGQIKVSGFSKEIAVNGAFTMIRGRLFILGKNLVFERGVVIFTGNFNPELDFLSTTTAPDATITVGVAGVASDPEFTFSSIPELPQDEIMALLLFNRSLDQLSNVQIATLASQIASLTSDLPIGLGTVRSSLGIDVLDLTTDQQGNAAVEVGKYINENIYLGVSRAGETSSVTVDIDITNTLKGRGELDEEGTSKLGLEFNYDY